MPREREGFEGIEVKEHTGSDSVKGCPHRASSGASSVKIPLECIVKLQNGFPSITIDLHGILTPDARCVHTLKCLTSQ